MKFPALLALVLLTLLPSAPRAQPVERGAITVRLLSWETPVNGLYHRDSSGYRPLDIPAFRRSAPVALTRAAAITLYAKTTVEGRETYQPVQDLALPDGLTECLVVLARRPPAQLAPGEPPFTALVIPTDPERHPARTLIALNLSPVAAAVKLTDTPESLDPWSWKLIPVRPDRKYRVWSYAALQLDGQWRIAGEEILSLGPNARGLLVVSIGQRGLAAIEGDYADTSTPRPIAFAEIERVPAPVPSSLP